MKSLPIFIILTFSFISSSILSQTIRFAEERESNLSLRQGLTTDLEIILTDDLDSLINQFLDYGVSVSNISFQGSLPGTGVPQIGIFDNALQYGYGINKSLVLATCDIRLIPQEASVQLNNQVGGQGYQPLTDLAGNSTFDAAVLSFDVVPVGNVLEFNYIFASEEYPQYVCSNYNDIFAFFISGKNPEGGDYDHENIALVPGTNMAVAINSINPGTHGSSGTAGGCTSLAYSHLYVSCSGHPYFALDGGTVKLTAKASVIPGMVYSLNIAIADVGDQIYDSAVMLETPSLRSYNSSNIKAIEFSDVNLYPNPINSESVILLKDFINKEVNLKLFDVSGREINNKTLINENGYIPANLILNNLNKGIYLISISSNDFSTNIKAVVD